MDGEQDILIACSVGNLYWLKKSLIGKEKMINKIVNNEGMTPLHLAAYQRSSLIMNYLMTHCKELDINALTCYTADSSLHLILSAAACNTNDDCSNTLDCMQLLLRKGAYCNKQNFKGQTALHLAAQAGLAPIVRLLLDHGADFSITDDNKQTSHDLACLHGNHECARLLSALHWANDKDSQFRHCLLTERQNNKERILQRNTQAQMRKQEADNSYDEWLNQNHFSPPPSRIVSQQSSVTRLSCETCSNSATHLTRKTSHSEKHPTVATIQISLNQADHNIKPVGKPHKLYPYSNYPPTQYRCHSARRSHMTSKSRPRSSASGRRSPRHTFTRARAKSAPATTSTVNSFTVSQITHKIPHTTAAAVKTITSQNNDSSDIHMIPVNEISDALDAGDNTTRGAEDSEIRIEDIVEDINGSREKKHINEGREEEEEGSTSSIDGLMFHEVGPENDLNSLASPTGTKGLIGGAPNVSPLELLHVFGELSSHRPLNRSQSHRPAQQQYNKLKRHSSLNAIPEGEIVNSYNEIEDSQLFDEDFLYHLMPFAFDSNHFQTTDDQPHPPPPSPNNSRQAWDSDQRPQIPSLKETPADDTSPATTPLIQVPPKIKVPQRASPAKFSLKPSIFEFGGHISYTSS